MASSGGSNTGKSATKKTKGGGIFGEFILGLILIGFALPMVWMNERKQVKIYKVLDKGREQVQKQTDCLNPSDGDNYKLIHTSGTLSTQLPVTDERFNIAKENTVKMRRIVQVCQWVERSHTEEHSDGETKTKYTYHKEFCDSMINQDAFYQDQEGPRNPKEWPCLEQTFKNQKVELGQFVLSESQVVRLQNWEQINIEEESENIISHTRDLFSQDGYLQLLLVKSAVTAGDEIQNNYSWFYTRRQDTQTECPLGNKVVNGEVGDVRIRWEIVKCSDCTVIAQQMEDDQKGQFTFRAWNPSKEKVAFEESNEPDIQVSCPTTFICCYIVEMLFKKAFTEVIDEIHDSKKECNELFDELESKNEGETTIFRWLSWIGSVIGHFFLFMPIIKLISWIPLVGALLSSVVSFASFIFALIWATMVHLLILGLAWIVYRPVLGIILLTSVGILLGVIFMY